MKQLYAIRTRVCRVEHNILGRVVMHGIPMSKLSQFISDDIYLLFESDHKDIVDIKSVKSAVDK